MDYDVIVVGGGIAGLTAAAYLARSGRRVLLCEKESVVGGLVRTFERDGFFFDGGIRSIEDSGIVLPMLRQLGLSVEFVKSHVSVGIEDRLVRFESEESLVAYGDLLLGLYPNDCDAVIAIISEIRRITGYMDVLYGLENPAFRDILKDRAYVFRVLLPWLVKYMVTMPKVARLGEPVAQRLRRYTSNQSLIDIIAQHFFQGTPTSFALSYFRLYLDYIYPRGGTGALVEALAAHFTDNGGQIATDTRITGVDPERRRVTADTGESYEYRGIVWAADLKTLYGAMDPDAIAEVGLKRALLERRAAVADKVGGDSLFTLYLALDLDPSYFAERASEHFFYTPSREGQSMAGPVPIGQSRADIEEWLQRFLGLTTYEISCPVMRDANLAPRGKTGLIVSMLFDYRLVKQIESEGWYQEFKSMCEQMIIDMLDETAFPGIKRAVLTRFSSTPLSIAKITGNSDGAITGWAFTNVSLPAEHRLTKILSAVHTPFTAILQAGQWTFSPSGLPISILTGKLAADEMQKLLT